MTRKFIVVSVIFAMLVMTLPGKGFSQGKKLLDSTSVQSIDSIIAKLYSIISQAPGKRNYDQFKALFLPNARLISIKVDAAGKSTFQNVTVDEYVEIIKPKLEKANYFEIEIGRRQEEYNNIAQVFSTYKSTLITEKDMQFESGINSFQLIYYKGRWWIASALFNNEAKENLIPDKYKFN